MAVAFPYSPGSHIQLDDDTSKDMAMGKLFARHNIRSIMVLLLLAPLAEPAAAQITSASVIGSVRDGQGAAIPGATANIRGFGAVTGVAAPRTMQLTVRFLF